MVFHRGHWLTPCLCGSATLMLQPATPTHRTHRLFPALWLVFLGRCGNTRAATFFHNLIALLRYLPFLTPFAQWFLYRFSRCAFGLHTAIMSRRLCTSPVKSIVTTLLLSCASLAFASAQTGSVATDELKRFWQGFPGHKNTLASYSYDRGFSDSARPRPGSPGSERG